MREGGRERDKRERERNRETDGRRNRRDLQTAKGEPRDSRFTTIILYCVLPIFYTTRDADFV